MGHIESATLEHNTPLNCRFLAEKQRTGSPGPWHSHQPAQQPDPGLVQGVPAPPVRPAGGLYVPPDQDWPENVGATINHGPIQLFCGACGYQGATKIRYVVMQNPKLSNVILARPLCSIWPCCWAVCRLAI